MRRPWWLESTRFTTLQERRINEELSLLSRRLKLCEDTLREHPDDPDALFTKGAFLAKIGEHRRALRCLERVTEVEPAYPGVWRAKAALHRKLGEVRAAEDCRRRAADEAV